MAMTQVIGEAFSIAITEIIDSLDKGILMNYLLNIWKGRNVEC